MHLTELDPYDADKQEPSALPEEEERVEALCDEERYLELHTDVAEKALSNGFVSLLRVLGALRALPRSLAVTRHTVRPLKEAWTCSGRCV